MQRPPTTFFTAAPSSLSSLPLAASLSSSLFSEPAEIPATPTIAHPIAALSGAEQKMARSRVSSARSSATWSRALGPRSAPRRARTLLFLRRRQVLARPHRARLRPPPLHSRSTSHCRLRSRPSARLPLPLLLVLVLVRSRRSSGSPTDDEQRTLPPLTDLREDIAEYSDVCC